MHGRLQPFTTDVWTKPAYMCTFLAFAEPFIDFIKAAASKDSAHARSKIDQDFPDSTLRGIAKLGDNNQVQVALVIYLLR